MSSVLMRYMHSIFGQEGLVTRPFYRLDQPCGFWSLTGRPVSPRHGTAEVHHGPGNSRNALEGFGDRSSAISAIHTLNP
jgi:hypothetical protein